MPYVLNKDFNRFITPEDLNNLTCGDPSVWQLAEVSALEEVKSYLRNRYDVSGEFDIPLHNSSLPYPVGSRVLLQTGAHQGVYSALQEVPAGSSITDTSFWAVTDLRNAKLVSAVTLIMLYENYTRLNGTEIPGWLQLRYDGGDMRQTAGIIGYLKMIQKGTVEPNIPLRADVAQGTSQNGNAIAFGVATGVVTRNTAI